MLTALVGGAKSCIRFLIGQPQVGETAESLQQTSLDNRAQEPPPEMTQELPADHGSASGDNPRRAGNSESGRNGGHRRAVSATTAHRYRGEQRTGRVEQLQSRLRSQTAHLKSLENDNRQLADEHELLKCSHHQLSETHRATETSLHETQTTCKKQQQEINTLKEKLRGASTLLEARNQELKVAKTFLSKEDPISISDATQSVRDLNSEIMQTAAHLAENLSLKRVRTSRAEDIPEGPHKSMLVTLILPQRSRDKVDEGSLELALQGFLVVCLHWVANAWGFNQASGWCDQLYSKVCETEDRTVASNWRSLTRRTLFNIDSSHDGLTRHLVNNMIEQLAQLLSSCGVGEPVSNANNIHKYAADKLGSLFTAARRLNKMIGENIISDDLMVTVIGGGHLFDGGDMEDAYARGELKCIRRAVICTTDLGLRERNGGKVFLKPKVALRNL